MIAKVSVKLADTTTELFSLEGIVKSFARLIVPCCVSMLFIGCLAKEREHETRRYEVGGNNEEPALFKNQCLEVFKKTPINTKTSDNYIITQQFFLKNNKKIKLGIGYYEMFARNAMGNRANPGSMFEQKRSGNYLAALRALNHKGITCKQVGEKVEFIFPVNDSDSEYDKLAVSCRNDCERIIVNIGLFKEISDKLAITITQFPKSNKKMMFHAFDTDRKGVIVRHRLSKGGGLEETWEEVWRER